MFCLFDLSISFFFLEDTSDGTLNHNKESHRSGKNQTTLEIKTPPKKNNKKKTDLEEKQEIKEYSRENLRRSTRVRRRKFFF